MKRLTVSSARLIATGIAFILFAISVVPGIGLAQQADLKAPLLDGLSGAQRASAERGRRLFELRFLPIPAEGLPGGGLGPLYIRNSCASCHVGSGRGTLPEARDGSLIGGVVYTAKPHLSYGTEIQPRSVPPVPHEGNIAVAWDVGDGAFLDEEAFSLRQPKLALEQANYGSPPPALALRMAPSLLGLGLLQSVPDVEILAWADPQDVNGDGISGRPNIVDDPVSGRRAVGRFGWKADRNSLISTVTMQAARFMGLTSSAHPDEPCAPAQLDCSSYAIGGRADLPDGVLRDLTAYVEALQQPVRKNTDDPLVLRGQELFRQSNCTACHRERLTTAAAVPGAAYLSGREFYAYTDLLLHDMGDELDDGQQSGRAATWEWRTPPLWGLDRPAQRGSDFGYLHDGRARSLTEAILWHGGEALASRNAFFVLPKEDRDALIAFLKSL